MIMISIATFYTGIEQSFFNSVYPSVIGFTKASSFGTESVKLIGLYGILNGLGEMTGKTYSKRKYIIQLLIHFLNFMFRWSTFRLVRQKICEQ